MADLMDITTERADDERVVPGVRVEVRTRFDARWAKGFEVAEESEDGFLVRRLSDGELLPAAFGAEDLRRERKRGMWWY